MNILTDKAQKYLILFKMSFINLDDYHYYMQWLADRIQNVDSSKSKQIPVIYNLQHAFSISLIDELKKLNLNLPVNEIMIDNSLISKIGAPSDLGVSRPIPIGGIADLDTSYLGPSDLGTEGSHEFCKNLENYQKNDILYIYDADIAFEINRFENFEFKNKSKFRWIEKVSVFKKSMAEKYKYVRPDLIFDDEDFELNNDDIKSLYDYLKQK